MVVGAMVATVGGGIGSAQTSQQPSVTFSKDVAPIFQLKCQTCHEPNSIAPMSLVTYAEARPWIRSIKDRVQSRQMPPWHIERSAGIQQFQNDMSLSDAQIDTIVRWVDAGAPQGDPKDLPPPRPIQSDNEWRGVRDGYGPPDLVVTSEEYTMPAKHQDRWYRTTSDLPITEPRWIRMVEIRPSSFKARRVLHHSEVYELLDPSNAEAAAGGGVGGPGAGRTPSPDDLTSRRPHIMEWAIGKGYDRFRDGTGRLIIPGEKLYWDMHLHAAPDEDVSVGSELALWFYPKGQEPKKRAYLILFNGFDRSKSIDIEPNSIAYNESFTVLRDNTLLMNFQPHMHLRGKAMQIEAILPNGSRQLISYVGNFNFNWMTNYIYADDAAPVFPKGTVIHVSAYHDNTRANKANPDPDQWVGYGERTVDEMAHAWINVIYLSDDEYKALLDERRAKAQQQQ
jgi:hypothetical protein